MIKEFNNPQGVLLIALSLSFLACLGIAQKNRPCLSNSNGTVTFDIQGVPGPEEPRGERGPRGNNGNTGAQGIRGKTGERGFKGDIGSMGIQGMTGKTGPKGQKGSHGIQGPLGPTGAAGLPGPQGIQGHPGDTILSEEEFNRARDEIAQAINASIINAVTEQLRNSILSEVQEKIKEMNQTLTEIKESVARTYCGISSHKWKRIAHLDTAQGDTCPPELRTFSSSATSQKACGTQASSGSVSLKFYPKKTYTHICGRVRGHLYYFGGGFYPNKTVDTEYADGVSITMGTPRQHLWTYAVGEHEQSTLWHACPCAKADYNNPKTPSFVGNHYYCENAFLSSYQAHTVWNDPLWDGKGCVTLGNRCCQRFGWFHREVALTQDYIEVRWMKVHTTYWTDIMTDQVEIWVT